jgi:hypothetical protein
MNAIFKKLILLVLTLLGSYDLYGHGFGIGTLVLGEERLRYLSFMHHAYIEGDNLYVKSLNLDTGEYSDNYVRVVAHSQTNCYFEIGFEPGNQGKIQCTPDQEFYNAYTQNWVPAFQLRVGDSLLAKDYKIETISSMRFIKSSLRIYAIEVDNDHNYFVGSRFILTHNMALPIAGIFGLSASFGSGAAAGGTAGSFFGPVTFFGGAVIGGLVGVGFYAMSGRDNQEYGSFFNTGDIEKNFRNAEQATKDKGGASAAGGGGGKDPNEGRGSKTGGVPPQEPKNEKPEKDKRQTPDQKTLHDLAQEAMRRAKGGNPISEAEAKILDEWAQELNVPQHHQAYPGSGEHFPGGGYQDHTHIYNTHVPYQ